MGETLLVPACENILYIFGNATFLTATMQDGACNASERNRTSASVWARLCV